MPIHNAQKTKNNIITTTLLLDWFKRVINFFVLAQYKIFIIAHLFEM